ncbi:hypothetical protein AX17_007545 [Amanita inopinata Kibby_2008]|nr:hypothetical protein AX17_007545 [Amanita inopinata Kibby_2008]
MVKLTAGLTLLVTTLGALGSATERRQGTATTLSPAQVASYKPYTYFAAAAACSPSLTITWRCGVKCDARPNFVPVGSGGDGSTVQYWYVGYDTSLSKVIVGYQGTDASKIIPILTDSDFFLESLSASLFPGLSSDIAIHDGFADAHARSAAEVLVVVKTAMSRSGYKNIAIVGHSLGGALAIISSVYFRLWLPAGTTINTVTYGMPRVGNQAFVDYVNGFGGNTRINNKYDIVPTIPGRFLDFHHTNTEVHILESLQWVRCDGEDNEGSQCTIGYVPDIFAGRVEDHEGPYDVYYYHYYLASDVFGFFFGQIDHKTDILYCTTVSSVGPNPVKIMSGIVNVFVVSPDTRSERRIDPHITVEQLKGKLEPVTGIPAGNQIISLFNSETASSAAAVLSDDGKQLSVYGLRDWQVLKVEDSNPSVSFTGQLTDISQVEKFELSEAEYEKRTDSVRAYKELHKVGRFAPKDDGKAEKPQIPADLIVGARCEVESLEEGLSKRGTVRFVGETKFSKGIWVGIEYDEPMGKNDGSVQGEKYFSCRPNYGVFVHPDKVQVGDFPVEELDLEDEEM